MTKEQAIEVLHELDGSLYETQQVALDLAIKALEQQPSEDAISRKAHNLCNSCTNIGCEFQSGIYRTECAFYMPPVTSTFPKDATNGEAIIRAFPNLKYNIQNGRVVTTIGVASSFDLEWWNAPYERGSENDSNTSMYRTNII